jgi:4-hydroxybenzoate polyprenyltransferase/phosphoserine phosphatase
MIKDTQIDLPIVVDLDGTLTPTDTLVESLIKLIKKYPLTVFRLPMWFMKGRAVFKNKVSTYTEISAEYLPYHEPFLAYLREEKEKGRRLILATAAHHSIADNVSEYLGIFDEVFATNGDQNLKGHVKLDAVRQKYGDRFVYAGNCRADVPIWKSCQAAILVGVPPALSKSVRQDVNVEREFSRERVGIATWLKALRVHQWVKNMLLFVPILTAFSFMQTEKLLAIVIAFVSFSLAASATYIVNDLWDLDSDRAHPRKRNRPFASAKLPIIHGLAVAAGLLTTGLLLAMTLSKGFVLMLLLYLVLTSTYSWVLKERVLIDVILLALLYTLRILAGSIAIGIATSFWLLAFSVFIFFSLALVKRCAELVILSQKGVPATRGRDYRVTDLVVLWPLGIGATLSAVVMFGLFISAPETLTRYATPEILWLVAITLIYWLSRIWLKTSRGEMHDDPVIYAFKDKGSRMTVLVMIIMTLIAHFITIR